MTYNKRSLNLNYFLKRELGYYNPKKVGSAEELEELHKNNRYVEKRSLSEYYKTLESMTEEELKHQKRAYRKPKKYSLYNEVKKIKQLRTDKFYTRRKNGKLIVVKDRFTLTRKEFEQAQKEFLTFITMMVMISDYGVVVDGIGHLYVKNKQFELNPNKIKNSGTYLKKMNVKTRGYTRELLDFVLNKGQQYAEIDNSFKDIFKTSGRKIIHKAKHDISKYVNIEEIAMQNALAELAKRF